MDNNTHTPVSIISACPVLVCREEVCEHMSGAAQHSQRAAELEGLLAAVKARVQDLEDRCLGKAVQQLGHTQQLQQENLQVQVGALGIVPVALCLTLSGQNHWVRFRQKRCQALEQKLSTQREEMAELQKKLYFSVKEEELRVSRQRRTFQNICNKVGLQNSPADQQ